MNKLNAPFARATGFVVIAASLAALAGVYNTNLLGWPVVWFYWAGLIGAGVWLGGAINGQLAPALLRLPWAGRWLIMSAAVTAPMFGIVSTAQTLIGHPVSAAGFPDLAAKVFFVSAAITGARMLPERNAGPQLAEAPADSVSVSDAPTDGSRATPAALEGAAARLSSRLPDRLKGADIWALSAEDHYVRVHTAAGDDLVLMRLSDAIAEMDGVDGARAHRSWWIARAGVAAVKRRTEGGVIVLKNGAEAPVSRRRFADLIAARWLEAEGASQAE